MSSQIRSNQLKTRLATNRQSPQVKSNQALENDRSVRLKPMKSNGRWRREKLGQIWVEESKMSSSMSWGVPNIVGFELKVIEFEKNYNRIWVEEGWFEELVSRVEWLEFRGENSSLDRKLGFWRLRATIDS